ncbi:MAG TPA: hypothetical protein VL463_02855 [Kofleriaceae bacterium]|nr:hypothetical protein [Kofleriaceae bacterium]
MATTSTDDRTFQYASIGGAAVLAAILFFVRFCGGVPMPPKPPPPRVDTAAAGDVLANADATALAYKGYIESDAQTAGVPVPSVEAMGKKLVPRSDESHFALAPGDRPREVAGLRLSAVVQRGDRGDDLVLVIANPGEVDLAYDIVTKPSYGTGACTQRTVRSFNAMVVAHHSEESRSECIYRSGMVLGIEKVETLELNPLESYYVSRVPPQAVGLELRLAQGHKPSLPGGVSVCNVAMSQTIRAGLENDTFGWRDLVDFYARHRCDSYSFPEDYRAFTKDGEKPLPAVSRGG